MKVSVRIMGLNVTNKMTASESAGFKVKILDIASPSRISVRLPRMEEEYFSLTNEMNIHFQSSDSGIISFDILKSLKSRDVIW